MARLEPLEPEPELADYVPYLDAALARWPDALRVATDAQLDRLQAGQPPGPIWPLIRALKLTGHARQQHQIGAILAHEATRALPCVLLTTTPQPLDALLDHLAPRPALRQLQLGFNTLQRGQLAPLLEAATWEALLALEISWTQDALDEADHALTHPLPLSRLRTLSLPWSRLGLASVRALAHAALPSLETLELDHCRLSDATAAHLIHNMGLPSLHTLDLSDNTLGDACILALSAPHRLPSLRHLTMKGADLSHDQLAALLSSPGAARLSRIDLRHNGDPARHHALRRIAPPSVAVALGR